MIIILLECGETFYLCLLVEKLNRARRNDQPSIYDVVITDDIDLVQNIEDIGPLKH